MASHILQHPMIGVRRHDHPIPACSSRLPLRPPSSARASRPQPASASSSARTAATTSPPSIARSLRRVARSSMRLRGRSERRDHHAGQRGLRPHRHHESMSILAPYGVYAGISVFAGNDGITSMRRAATSASPTSTSTARVATPGSASRTRAGSPSKAAASRTWLRNGSSARPPSARIVIRNTVFRDNGGFGVTIAGAVESTIDDVHADRNALGGFSFVGTNGTVSHSVIERQRRHRRVRSARRRSTTTTIAISDHASSNNAGNGIDAQVSSAAAGLRHRLAQRDVGQYAARCARDDHGPGHGADHPLLFGTHGQRRVGGHGGHRRARSSSSTAPRSPRIRSACRACRSASCAAPATTRSPTT